MPRAKKDPPSLRDHWEDPRPADLALEHTWHKTKWGKRFVQADRRWNLRFVVAALGFCFLLSVLIFMPLRVSTDLRIGDQARVDVVAPLSFEMVDEVTTEEKRQKALLAVEDLYDYDPDVFSRVVSAVDRSFRNMRAFGRKAHWPVLGRHHKEGLRPFLDQKLEFQEQIQISMPDELYEWLVLTRFSPRIENALIRQLEQWYEKRIVELPERYALTNEEIRARTLSRNMTHASPESVVQLHQVLDLHNPEAFQASEFNQGETFNEADRSNLLRFARLLVQPNLTFNKAETQARKQKARDEVLPVNIAIKRNQNIIGQGSVVQPFHMAVIRQIEILQADRRQGWMALALAFLLATGILVMISFQKHLGLEKWRFQKKDFFVMMLLAICQVFFTKIFLFVMEAVLTRPGVMQNSLDQFQAMAPMATAPMLVGLLIVRGEVVFIFALFMAICLGIMEDFHFGVFMAALLSGLAGAKGVHNCKKRNDIYWAGLRAGLVNAFVFASYELVTRFDLDLKLSAFGWVVVAAFIGGILSSMLTMMVVPLLESVFEYTTDVKLLELSNLNHPLLKEMIVKAPGTYHHSIMVGSMVEAAAEEIGANPLLGKVMCYYHDIGKMEYANYFIENQKPGHNPHDHISPYMSKTLLIAHVKDGVELGNKHKLGAPIIDGILQHHGTTLISFFYNKALDLLPEGEAGVAAEEFRYPGPKPQFKEAALCMLADSIEAAARSLDEPTSSRLQNIVRNIIQKKFSDGQLDECHLTLKDLAKIENAFVRILLGIYHQRIDYPRE